MTLALTFALLLLLVPRGIAGTRVASTPQMPLDRGSVDVAGSDSTQSPDTSPCSRRSLTALGVGTQDPVRFSDNFVPLSLCLQSNHIWEPDIFHK